MFGACSYVTRNIPTRMEPNQEKEDRSGKKAVGECDGEPDEVRHRVRVCVCLFCVKIVRWKNHFKRRVKADRLQRALGRGKWRGKYEGRTA